MRNFRKMNGEPNLPHRKRTFWEIVSGLKGLFNSPFPYEPPVGNAGGSSAGQSLGSAGKRAFIKAYNSNAMNFLPGRMVHAMYARSGSQRSIEARAETVLRADEALLTAAWARGYTG
jgi:hypothetical protein